MVTAAGGRVSIQDVIVLHAGQPYPAYGDTPVFYSVSRFSVPAPIFTVKVMVGPLPESV
jgi:hypothetical protein